MRTFPRQMHPYLGAALDAIEGAVGQLDVPTIGRAVEGRWSIASILEHLTLAFRGNAETVEKALASGEARGRPPRITQALARMLVVELGYFPRIEAPERTRPSGSIPPERSLTTVRAALTALDANLTRASERFGDRARIANHPYFAGMTVPQWRKFHWRHTVHHMRQVRART